MLTEIDHVAIAVNDLEAAIAWYAEVFGARVDHRERVERDGVEVAHRDGDVVDLGQLGSGHVLQTLRRGGAGTR